MTPKTILLMWRMKLIYWFKGGRRMFTSAIFIGLLCGLDLLASRSKISEKPIFSRRSFVRSYSFAKNPPLIRNCCVHTKHARISMLSILIFLDLWSCASLEKPLIPRRVFLRFFFSHLGRTYFQIASKGCGSKPRAIIGCFHRLHAPFIPSLPLHFSLWRIWILSFCRCSNGFRIFVAFWLQIRLCTTWHPPRFSCWRFWMQDTAFTGCLCTLRNLWTKARSRLLNLLSTDADCVAWSESPSIGRILIWLHIQNW